MLLLSDADVLDLLPMTQAIELMRAVFRDLAAGCASNQPRRRLILPSQSVLHYMAAGNDKYFGAKVYSTHPRHGAHFVFLLYSTADARPLALLEANSLGQIRTGAASGLATQWLSRPESETVAVIGSGFQARSQLEAIAAVRPIKTVRVWSRSAEKRRRFAEECGLPLSVTPVDTAEQAVRGADIVVTATNAREPVLASEWIAPGAHVNAMGSNQADRRELPSSLIHRADLIAVDSLEQARMESGDLILALDEAGWSSPKLVELKDITARPPGAELTVFKSNGLALEDVAAAGYVYERALMEGRGRELYS